MVSPEHKEIKGFEEYLAQNGIHGIFLLTRYHRYHTLITDRTKRGPTEMRPMTTTTLTPGIRFELDGFRYVVVSVGELQGVPEISFQRVKKDTGTRFGRHRSLPLAEVEKYGKVLGK